MDCFDDIQIEDFSTFDFVEEMNEFLSDGEDDDRLFPNIHAKFDVNEYLNGNYDY